MLGAVRIYPFRCQVCSTRFRTFTLRRFTRHSADPRQYERLAVRVGAVVTAGTETTHAETADLALDGCSIRTSAVFPAGATVQVRLRLDGGDVHVESAVVRSAGAGAVAVQFVGMTASDRARLGRYLEGKRLPLATARRRPAAPRPPVLVVAVVGGAVIVLILLLLDRIGGPAVP